MTSRSKKLSCLLVLVVVAALVVGPTSASAAPTGTAASALLRTMNQVRAQYRLTPFRVDPTLARAARAHSLDMLRRNYFEHGDMAGRLLGFGARGPALGENLAWGSGSYGAPRHIVDSWLASPGHRANLLRPGFRRVGIAAPVGTFAGYPDSVVVTADFAGT